VSSGRSSRTALSRARKLTSPTKVAREVRLRLRARRAPTQLRRAARSSTPILVGPFLGEVGFELLYWIPSLRRILAEAGARREQVVAISRGGAEPWYTDVAARYVDALDVFDADDYRRELVDRHRRAGDRKQLWMARLDRDVIRRAADALGLSDYTLVHPAVTFARLRHLWAGREPLGALGALAIQRPLDVEPGLPGNGAWPDDGYVALKPYFGDAFPLTEANERFLVDLAGALAARRPVVLLSNALELDEHLEAQLDDVPGLIRASEWMTARDNLDVQTRLISGAQAFVSTYGGFAYLGPLLGVPTGALYRTRDFNLVHLEVMRAYERELGLPALRVVDTSSRSPQTVADMTSLRFGVDS
jgi:hypothetical protein